MSAEELNDGGGREDSNQALLENVVLVPNFVANSDFDHLALMISELSEYRVASVMDGGEEIDKKVVLLDAEVKKLLAQHTKEAFNAYLQPYFDLKRKMKENRESIPFPLSKEERARLLAAQYLLILEERGEY